MADDTSQNKVRTRIAPSPTGYPHIGTIYQALFNFAFTKKHTGKFLVRIEDTDQTRFVEGSEEVIFNALDWFGLTEDESPRKGGEVGPYRQSERLPLYHEYAQKLLDMGHAEFDYYKKDEAGQKKDYSHKDTLVIQTADDVSKGKKPSSIQEMITMENWVLRMKIPSDESITIHDEIRGDIIFDSNQVTSQVLIKSDGFPTYHFAVVIDDHLMKISHILRAEEWISSTPKHVLLYKYFGWDMPPIYHTATLRNPDKSKLSKRHGHTNVLWFQEEGYLPQAILNFLALLGWSHPEEKEIFSMSEFIQEFDLKDIHPIAPVFDLTKLTWMNGIYIREVLTTQQLIEALYTFDSSLQDIDTSLFEKLVEIAKSRIKTLKEFKEMIHPFMHQPTIERTNDQKALLQKISQELEQISDWNKDAIAQVILGKFVKAKIVSFKDLYSMLIDTDKGLPLADTFEVLGKEKTLAFFQSNE